MSKIDVLLPVDEIESFLQAAQALAEAVRRREVSPQAAAIAVAGAAIAAGVNLADVFTAANQIRHEWQEHQRTVSS